MNPETRGYIPEEEVDDFDDSPYADTNKKRAQYKLNLESQRKNAEKGEKKVNTEGAKRGKEMFDEFVRRQRAGENIHDVHEDLKRKKQRPDRKTENGF